MDECPEAFARNLHLNPLITSANAPKIIAAIINSILADFIYDHIKALSSVVVISNVKYIKKNPKRINYITFVNVS